MDKRSAMHAKSYDLVKATEMVDASRVQLGEPEAV
jgi:hypothetical protein